MKGKKTVDLRSRPELPGRQLTKAELQAIKGSSGGCIDPNGGFKGN